MNAKRKKLSRRKMERLDERVEQLERLRQEDCKFRDAQLSARINPLLHALREELRQEKSRLLRAEKRLRNARTLSLIASAICLAATVTILLTIRVGGQEVSKAEPPMPAASGQEAVETNENQYIEAALLSRSTRIDNCTITYYCTQPYAHICGTGDGITATGTQVSPGVSCAVDPDVIPLGSDVLVDYGDGELHYYKADDTGVTGSHIDLAVAGHDEALSLGVRTATVYWCENTL